MSIYTTNHSGPASVIHYVDRPCGSGKTQAFIEMVCKHLQLKRNNGSCIRITHGAKNFCYVGPTLQKLCEIEADFKTRGIQPVRIDSTTHPRRAIPEITRWLKSKRHEGQVLLITHEAYLLIPYFNRREDWNIVIDEVPQCDTFREPMLPRSWRFLLEHLTIIAVVKNNLGVLQPINGGRVRKYLEQPRDDREEVMREILADVMNPNMEVLVDLTSWERLTELAKVSKDNDELNKIYFLSMLKPEAFIGTTVMGADVRHSMLWHWMLQKGVQWVEHKAITDRLQYRAYPESVQRRLHVVHAMDNGVWSKHQRNKMEKLGAYIDDDIATLVEDGEKFLLVQNNDRDGRSPLEKLPGFQRLSSACHGLNCYQHYKKIVFMSALNRRDKHARMLREFGFSDSMQRDSILHSSLHQSVMRTALRNPESEEHVQVIVPDRFFADALVEAIGGAWVSDAGSEFEERFRRPVERSVVCGTPKQPPYKIYKGTDTRVSHATPASSTTPPPHGPTLSLTSHKLGEKNRPTHITQEEVAPLKLVTWLEEMSKRSRDTKRDDWLFQLTKYRSDVTPGAGFLAKKNFEFSSGICLDFDGGTVSPAEFIRIFWTDAGTRTKRSFVITNTFSTCPDTPHKFRAILPFNGRADMETHREIFETIVRRLVDAGHTGIRDFMRDSTNVVQSYFAPVTNSAHPASAFFEVRGLRRTDEFEKYAIRPSTYAPYITPKEQRPWTKNGDDVAVDREEKAIEKAREMWDEIDEMVEDRRKPVFDVAVVLMRRGGMDSFDASYLMMDWAYGDPDLERHIEGAVDYLDKHDGGGGGGDTSGPSVDFSSPEFAHCFVDAEPEEEVVLVDEATMFEMARNGMMFQEAHGYLLAPRGLPVPVSWRASIYPTPPPADPEPSPFQLRRWAEWRRQRRQRSDTQSQ